MQFQIEDLGPARKQVRIEIPARTVDSTFATVYNQLAQTASLPGFRKGKVPISHVRGSHQFSRVFHEVIIFTIIVTRCRRGGAMCSAFTDQDDRVDG